MGLKTNELIILSYINKFKKVDYIEIQKEINEPILQLSNTIYDLYNRKYFIITENGEGAEVTERAKAEPIHIWDAWRNDEELEFIGNAVYDGEKNQFGVPEISEESNLEEILRLHDMKEDSYQIFQLNNGKKTRVILAPSMKLKERQRWILRNILGVVKNRECVHGFVKGKSIVTNARCHVAKKEILSMDISDFFPTIEIEAVINVFLSLGYKDAVAQRLAFLCTYEGQLPQGAPTSPALANIIFDVVDRKLIKYAEDNGLVYTRYADDLTFSTNDDNIATHILKIKEIVEKSGYKINERKTHVMKDNYRKIVTGLIVNEEVKIPKRFKNKFRQEIYYSKKYGISQHLNAIGRNNAVNFKEYMYGKAYFIKMVEKELGDYYLNELDELFSNSFIYV